MISKKINLMPPLEMRKATCLWTIKALKHSNEPEPKNLSETPIKVESKSQVDFECKGSKTKRDTKDLDATRGAT